MSDATEEGTRTTRPGTVLEGESVELPAGARLGRYVVHKVLAHGGMAVVYAAYDPKLDRDVAV
jgi:hypothetical protein